MMNNFDFISELISNEQSTRDIHNKYDYSGEYIDIKDLDAVRKVKIELFNGLRDILTSNRPIFIICIGTDKSTGDSIGPLTGYKLKNMNQERMIVCGSLEYPVHALNIEDIHDKLLSSFKNPFFIAIDACLGEYEDIGKIKISSDPIRPGAGVGKNIREIGHLSVKAIVGESGWASISSVRLNLTMQFVDIISEAILGINKSILEINKTI